MSAPAASRLLKATRRRLVEGSTPGEPNLETGGVGQGQTEAAPAARLLRRAASAREAFVGQRGGTAVCYGPETLPMPTDSFGGGNPTYRVTQARGWGRPNRLLRVPRLLVVTADADFAGNQIDVTATGDALAAALASLDVEVVVASAWFRGGFLGVGYVPDFVTGVSQAVLDGIDPTFYLGGELLVVDLVFLPGPGQGPVSGAPPIGPPFDDATLYEIRTVNPGGGDVDVAFPAPFCADLQDKWAAVVARCNKAKVKIIHAHDPAFVDGTAEAMAWPVADRVSAQYDASPTVEYTTAAFPFDQAALIAAATAEAVAFF